MFFAKFAQIDFKRLILGSEGLMKNFDRKWNYLEFERSQNCLELKTSTFWGGKQRNKKKAKWMVFNRIAHLTT